MRAGSKTDLARNQKLMRKERISAAAPFGIIKRTLFVHSILVFIDANRSWASLFLRPDWFKPKRLEQQEGGHILVTINLYS